MPILLTSEQYGDDWFEKRKGKVSASIAGLPSVSQTPSQPVRRNYAQSCVAFTVSSEMRTEVSKGCSTVSIRSLMPVTNSVGSMSARSSSMACMPMISMSG